MDNLHQAGGLERILAIKIDYWLRVASEVTVITHSLDAPDFYKINAAAGRVSLGVRYDRNASLFSPGNMLTAIRHFRRLRSQLRGARPDLVIHCGYGYDFYFLPLVTSRRTALVKENHSSRYASLEVARSWREKIKSSLRAAFESRYDASVFLSREEADLSGQDNAVVIPNALNTVVPLPGSRKPRIIAAGRICHVKGFDRLIRAWALAAARLPAWRLAIYGDGDRDDVSALVNLVEELSVRESVDIFPATSEILDRMAESRIYGMASRSECFPMVLLEAMQNGLPVVAFDCPTGPRNIVTDGETGFLIPDGDLRAFADALVAMASQPKLLDRMSEAARIQSTKFNMEAVSMQWVELFARVGK